MSKNKLLKCEKCDYVTDRRLNLDRHAKRHLKAAKTAFKCTSCDYKTMIKCNYDKHIITHTTTLHRCNACNITVKDIQAHKKTNCHIFTYGGIKSRYGLDTYYGLTMYLGDIDKRMELINKTFNFEKYMGKPVFTIQKKGDKVHTVSVQETVEQVKQDPEEARLMQKISELNGDKAEVAKICKIEDIYKRIDALDIYYEQLYEANQ